MFERRFLYPRLAAVIVLSSFSSAAWAAHPAPTAPWTVAPLASKSSAGTNYCSMKTTFPDGQTLVFARDDQGSHSIALDVHADKFEAGNHYEIKVSASSVKRNMTALGASTQVIVTQVGIDPEFYDALKSRHTILFSFKKSKYGFELDPSVADALDALDKCANGFDKETPFTPVTFPLGKVSNPAALPPAPPEEPVTAAEETPKKGKKSNKKKPTKSDVELLKEALALESAEVRRDLIVGAQAFPALPAPPHDPERDSVKAQIASEILQLHSQKTGKPVDAPLHADGPATAAAPVEAVEVAAPPAPPAAPESAPVAAAVVADNGDLKKLIISSKIVDESQIQNEDDALRWTGENLYGMAQSLTASAQNLAGVAEDYLKKNAAMCRGDFAKKVQAPRKAGKADVLEADITCVDGENMAGAALLFISSGDNKISVITQEGALEELPVAMLKRDDVINVVSGGKPAAKKKP